VVPPTTAEIEHDRILIDPEMSDEGEHDRRRVTRVEAPVEMGERSFAVSSPKMLIYLVQFIIIIILAHFGDYWGSRHRETL
jgi:hypothetical protein